MRLADALLHALKAHGAREIFGIPGDFALPLFKAIEDGAILPLYTLAHEPAVGFAADAAARINCGLGVAAVTYGAGALNVVNAVAGAFAERSPVVVLSGAPSLAERGGGLLLHHQVRELDTQFRIFSEITCDQAVLDDLGTAPREIARVLRSCRERSLPVYLEIPRDMPMADCASVLAAASWPTDPEVAAACADEILQLLSAARSPALMVGVEVRRYGLEAKVAELARRLGLPVVTSFMGRGLLTEAGVPVLGTYLGRAGRREVTDLVEGSDGLLLLGVIVSDTNFGVSARKIDMRRTIHAFDRQVRLRHHVYPNLPLSALVEALLTRCAGREATGPARSDASYPGGLIADEAPIRPADIAAAVNDAMAEHGRLPIACDVGDCLFTAMEIAHTHLVAPGYYAGMGFGVPAGLGLQATTGQRPLILVGDGAFAMTGWELGVCRRHGWDPIVIVFNNRGWEMLRAFEPGARFNDLEDWHFADIAKSLGGEGRRVATRSELQSALAHALAARGRFQLVEAMLARGAISDTLTRFVAALGAARGADMKGSGT